MMTFFTVSLVNYFVSSHVPIPVLYPDSTVSFKMSQFFFIFFPVYSLGFYKTFDYHKNAVTVLNLCNYLLIDTWCAHFSIALCISTIYIYCTLPCNKYPRTFLQHPPVHKSARNYVEYMHIQCWAQNHYLFTRFLYSLVITSMFWKVRVTM
jgi:hypothetical protein